MLAERIEASGRRWRYAVPRTRVALSVALLVTGFALAAAALAKQSLELGIASALALLPGAWGSRVYYGIYYNNEAEHTRFPLVWLEEIEIAD